MPTPRTPAGIDRRAFMGLCSALGLGGGRLPAALWVRAAPALEGQGGQGSQAPAKITREMLIAAETVARTGHPALVVPNGFNSDGTPVSISDFHRQRPQKFA